MKHLMSCNQGRNCQGEKIVEGRLLWGKGNSRVPLPFYLYESLHYSGID